jgi:type II secretory pathway pseudopilin PulG
VTLIELLVVIAIIAILMGLLLSAVMRVLTVKSRAETSARITAINNGVTTLKAGTSRYSAKYIPPGRWEPGTDPNFPTPGWYPFRLQNTYPSAAPGITTTAGLATCNSFEAQYIIQVFNLRPQQDPSNNNYPMLLNLAGYDQNGKPNSLNAQLDANQTLTFFLTGMPQVSGTQAIFTGFSTNPAAPFTPRATPDEPRLGPMLDLGGGGSNSKYAVDQTTGFARLLDAYGNPFVYFAPLNGLRNLNYGGYNTVPPGSGMPKPYSTNGQFENADGFQLISAGRDNMFGTTGDWANVGPQGSDDQANFSPNVLGAGK